MYLNLFILVNNIYSRIIIILLSATGCVLFENKKNLFLPWISFMEKSFYGKSIICIINKSLLWYKFRGSDTNTGPQLKAVVAQKNVFSRPNYRWQDTSSRQSSNNNSTKFPPLHGRFTGICRQKKTVYFGQPFRSFFFCWFVPCVVSLIPFRVIFTGFSKRNGVEFCCNTTTCSKLWNFFEVVRNSSPEVSSKIVLKFSWVFDFSFTAYSC